VKIGEINNVFMINKPKRSLVRNTLVLIIVPVIILWALYLFVIYQGVYKNTLEKQIDKTSLLNFECATRINNQLSVISNEVYSITHSVELSNTLTLLNIENRLTKILQSNKHIYGTSVSLKDVQINDEYQHDFFLYKYKSGDSIKRVIINDKNYSSYPYKEKEWYKYSATYFETKWSNPYFDKGLGNILMITYSTPLFINNRFAGVIGIDVNVSSLNSIITDASNKSESVFNKTQVIVFSSDSTIVVDAQAKHIGKKFNEFYGVNQYKSLTQALDTMFSNNFGYSNFIFNKIKYRMFYGPIPQANWIVVSILESSRINNAVWQSILPKLIMTAVFILILIILIYILSKKIVQPITELCDVTLEIAHGDYNKKISINRKDELGMLAHNFHIMKENLKKREQNLREASRNVKQLLDNLPLTVLQFNRERKIIYYNNIGRDRLYSNFDKASLQNFTDWLSFIKNPDDRMRAENAFKGKGCVLEGYNIITDSKYGKSYFTNKYVQAHFIPSLKNNTVASVTLIILDLTEVKQNENLRVEKKSAEIANKAKSEFLARMSHEIRTPLNAVIGFTNLSLQKPISDSRLVNYLTKIKASANHLLTIINDILDYSKIEAGKIELEKTSFDIEELLNEVFDLGASIAHDKNLELIISHSPLIPYPLMGDPVKLKQIIVNLVSNAIKFTQEGEIHVNVDIEKQTKNRTTLLVSVKDTGIGLSKEQQKILFQPFVQADGSITRRFGGTGIGLTISKRLVELMKGKIWIESEEGKGSIFWFTAEFKSDNKNAGFVEYIKKFNLPEDIRNLNVLVCDDNTTSLDIVKTMLEAFNLSVHTVNNGSEVINLLERGSHYDLLIIDTIMPEPDGIKTMQIIRDNKLRDNIDKVMLLTAYENLADESELANIGIDLLQPKPLTYSGLFDGIMAVFGKKSPGSVRYKRQRKAEGLIQVVSKNCKVLVADDNEVNREVAGDLLESMGLQVEFATNGEEVVKMVQSSGSPSKYCLVFMDLQMPLMDGYESTRAIRRLALFNDLPIIALSADVMQGVKQRCTEAGMNDFVSKPIDPSELAGVITRWLKNVNVKKSPLPAVLSGLNHLKAQEGVNRIGGEASRYIELLKKFSANQHDFIKKLNSLQRKEDKLKIVHSFKGVTGNISATDLHALVIDLENRIKTDEEYIDLMLLIDEELKKVIAEIGRIPLKSKAEQKTASSQKTKEQLKTSLDKIIKLLEEGKPDAIEELEKLAPYFKETPSFSKSVKMAKSYNFDEAVSFIKTIKL